MAAVNSGTMTEFVCGGDISVPLWVQDFDRACHGRVRLLATFGELRAVGDFLGQRMFERKAGLWVDRFVVEELGLAEPAERDG